MKLKSRAKHFSSAKQKQIVTYLPDISKSHWLPYLPKAAGIVQIFGMMGSGKTSTLIWLAEWYKVNTKRKVYWLDLPEALSQVFLDTGLGYIESCSLSELEDIEDAVVLADEAVLTINPYKNRSDDAIALGQDGVLMRQRDTLFILASQRALTNVHLRELAGVMLVKRIPDSTLEDSKMLRPYKEIIKQLPKSQMVCIGSEWKLQKIGIVTLALPESMKVADERISKAYKGLRRKQRKKSDYDRLIDIYNQISGLDPYNEYTLYDIMQHAGCSEAEAKRVIKYAIALDRKKKKEEFAGSDLDVLRLFLDSKGSYNKVAEVMYGNDKDFSRAHQLVLDCLDRTINKN